MIEIHGFQLEKPYPSWYNKEVKQTKFKNLKDLFQDFEVNLLEKVAIAVEGNSNYPGGGYLATASLIKESSYSGQQLPELADYLLKSGWTLVNTFVNRNTGNTLNFYTRFLTEKELVDAGVDSYNYESESDESDDE